MYKCLEELNVETDVRVAAAAAAHVAEDVAAMSSQDIQAIMLAIKPKRPKLMSVERTEGRMFLEHHQKVQHLRHQLPIKLVQANKQLIRPLKKLQM